MIVFATGVLAYVCALALRTDALLAALCAGLALSHGGRRRITRKQPLGVRVLRFAGRAERGATVVVMVLLGTLLGAGDFTPRAVLYAAVLLILVRPFAVRLGLGQPAVTSAQRRMVELFAARGPAALYCLALVPGHDLPRGVREATRKRRARGDRRIGHLGRGVGAHGEKAQSGRGALSRRPGNWSGYGAFEGGTAPLALGGAPRRAYS